MDTDFDGDLVDLAAAERPPSDPVIQLPAYVDRLNPSEGVRFSPTGSLGNLAAATVD